MADTPVVRTATKEELGFFAHTKKSQDIRKFNLYNGITDFGNAKQFDYYESGYSGIVILKAPAFMVEMARLWPDKYEDMVYNFHHLLQNEFRGLDGLENVNTDTLEVSDGIKTMQFISKVNQQGGTTITLNGYKERSGSLITKYIETYLYGIKDPGNQIKHYNGVLEDSRSQLQPLYSNEVFTILYIVTDNTGRNIERAYILYNCQLTNAETGIYNSERGDIQNKEISIEMNCIPVFGPKITEKAQSMLKYIYQYKYSDGTDGFKPTIVGLDDNTDGLDLKYKMPTDKDKQPGV